MDDYRVSLGGSVQGVINRIENDISNRQEKKQNPENKKKKKTKENRDQVNKTGGQVTGPADNKTEHPKNDPDETGKGEVIDIKV